MGAATSDHASAVTCFYAGAVRGSEAFEDLCEDSAVLIQPAEVV